MSRKAKPIRTLTDWPAINEQVEIAGATRSHTTGDHVQWDTPSGAHLTTLTGGRVCHGTRASVIRMALRAGLPILTILVLAIVLSHILL